VTSGTHWAADGVDASELAEAVSSAKLITLGRLLAGVAHELNTPMGALNSNHDTIKRALGRLQSILADEVVEPAELDEVRRVVSALAGVLRVNDMAIERMRSLVTSLRSFGRTDQAQEPVDLHETLEGALALLRHEMGDRIDVRRDFGRLPAIEGYPQQLAQAFMNLLHNAVQAIPGKGTITLRTVAVEGGATVAISDTGSGIPPEILARIFEPGFSTKGSRVGMGLGLLITQQVVDRHFGRLTVESTLGVGTTFTTFLPARAPTAATAAPEQ
jgi:two-component system NtrC family sensor kinase